jgi:hypothetical protein
LPSRRCQRTDPGKFPSRSRPVESTSRLFSVPGSVVPPAVSGIDHPVLPWAWMTSPVRRPVRNAAQDAIKYVKDRSS